MSDSKWLSIKKQYPINYKFKGKVFRIRPYGIFIKIDNIKNNNSKYLGIINVGHSAWCPKDCKKLPFDYSEWPRENTFIDCMVWYYNEHSMQLGLCWLGNDS